MRRLITTILCTGLLRRRAEAREIMIDGGNLRGGEATVRQGEQGDGVTHDGEASTREVLHARPV